MKSYLLRCLAVLLLGCLSGCSWSAQPKDIVFTDIESNPPLKPLIKAEAAPLRVAVATVLFPTETTPYYKAIVRHLEQELQRPVILIQRKSRGEIGTLLLNGGADVGFMSAGTYTIYANVEGLEVLVGQERMGLPYYRGCIVVPADSSAQRIADLEGRKMALVDPNSYSGYMYVAQTLAMMGKTPETFFGQYIYTYNHDKALRAVASKLVDAAAIDNLVYENARGKNPELAKAVRVIALSEPVLIGPIVASKKLTGQERQRLREVFLAMHQKAELAPALTGLLIDRFTLFDGSIHTSLPPRTQL